MTMLQTANLKLTPCSPADRNDFIDLERDPEVMRFLNGGAVDHETTDPEKVTFLMPRGTEPGVWTARQVDNDALLAGSAYLRRKMALRKLAIDCDERLGGKGMRLRPHWHSSLGDLRPWVSKRSLLARWR